MSFKQKKPECKEKIKKNKPGEVKYFKENDQRFFDDPFLICVEGAKL